MKLLKHKAACVLLFVAVLVGSLVVPSGTASATSVYDNAVQLTSSVVVAASSSSTPIDVTRNWSSHIAAASGSCTSGVKTSLLNALDHGSVAVNQELNNGSSTDYRRVQVSWSESATTPMIWTGSGSSASVVFPSIYPGPPTTGGAIFFMNTSGNVQVFCDVAAFGQAWSNAAGTAKGLFATNSPSYPTGYAGETIPAATPAAEYVAMGDSYSSGEGNSPYEAGSDTLTNSCHRSDQAYPRMLQSILNVGSMAFVACSGATTADVINGSSAEGGWGEDPQVDALSSDANNVTITVGGNDLGFGEVLTKCAEAAVGTVIGWGCSTDINLNDDVDDRMAALDDRSGTSVLNPDGKEVQSILSVLTAISSAAPNARIFIAGYPKLFGSDAGDFTANGLAPGGAVCDAQSTGATYSYDDAQWMNDRTDELNQAISDAVDQAVINEIDATYVSPGLFGEHGLCDSSTAWLNGILLDSNLEPSPESMHPNSSGVSIGYELAFETLMD